MLAVGVTALGMTAASASAELALPDISLLSGETFPLYMQFADDNKTPTLLETTAGAVLRDKGVEALLELAALGALGSFKAKFLNVANTAGESCNTTGDNTGEVLVTGEWHLVPLNTSPLENGIAFLLGSLVLITCTDGEKVDVRGCALSTFSATQNGVDLTEFSVALGSNGKGSANKREYLNDLPKFVKCTLDTEIVGTKVLREGALVINEGKEIKFNIETGSLAKMFEFTGL
jgi:hypothetical protein